MIQIFNTKCHPTSIIRASCGDDVTNKLAFSISIKDSTIDYDAEKFVNCATDIVVCFRCFLAYLTDGSILFTEKARDKWMKA
jgi:hypothetical protein